jgi:sialate O-acetylesterase
MEWKEPAFDDSTWRSIAVPAWWETQGFRDYDGYAWYRTTFTVPVRLRQERLIAVLGMIDDLDEVYLNGERIGRTGFMSSNTDRISFSDEYQEVRAYTISPELLSTGKENVLAVRVYDGFKDGGIYRGPIGIVTRDRYRVWEAARRKQDRKEWNLIDFFLK